VSRPVDLDLQVDDVMERALVALCHAVGLDHDLLAALLVLHPCIGFDHSVRRIL